MLDDDPGRAMLKESVPVLFPSYLRLALAGPVITVSQRLREWPDHAWELFGDMLYLLLPYLLAHLALCAISEFRSNRSPTLDKQYRFPLPIIYRLWVFVPRRVRLARCGEIGMRPNPTARNEGT
jgi:hypothetical protein